MRKLLLMLGLVLCSLGLSSCGGGASGGAGLGNTVQLAGAIKTGTVGVSNTSLSTGGGSMSFTLTSTVPPSSGTPSGIPASPVQITSIQMTYTPMRDSNGNMSPSLVQPAPVLRSTPVAAGSSSDIDNVPILLQAAQNYLQTNYGTVLSTTVPALQYQYLVTLTFSGTEQNTGTPISCQVYVTLWVSA